MKQPEILYEDNSLLVVGKPAGMVVNRSENTPTGTVQQWLLEQFPHLFSQLSDSTFHQEFVARTGIAHRLDKDTSGVLLVAKTPEALHNLFEQFQQHNVKKTYVCLVHGKINATSGEISEPIGRDPKRRTRFAVRPDGRESMTRFSVQDFFPHLDIELVLKRSAERSVSIHPEGVSRNFRKAVSLYQGFSLVQAFPTTGRTHQLRVHFAFIKHPIVGDALYGGEKRQYLDKVWCSRQFLHAQSIEIHHPVSDQLMKFEMPLPSDLSAVLELLTK